MNIKHGGTDHGTWKRNQRFGVGAIAIIVALVSLAALARAFRSAERPASQPTPPKPSGIFSEVGGWIAYGNQRGIWAVDPSHPGDRGSQVQLSSNQGTPLAWSSDGSELLISNRRGLFVLHADGTETRLLRDRVKGASFSADGTSVVFASGWTAPGSFDEGIYLIDADGGTLELLLAASRGHQLSYPTFSPDGAQIAYIDGQGDLGNSLRVMNADGSDVHVLGRKGSLGGHTIGLSWSPGGTRLAVGVRYIGPSGIYVVDADGSGVTLLIDYRVNPYWSPDGLRISFEYDFAKRIGLQIADPNGTHLQNINYAKSGPWNPLVQPEQEPEVADVPAASVGLTLTSTLLLLLALLALVAGAVLIRRMEQRS